MGAVNEKQEPKTSKVRIFILDRDPWMAEYTTEILSPKFNCTAFTNLANFLAYIRTTKNLKNIILLSSFALNDDTDVLALLKHLNSTHLLPGVVAIISGKIDFESECRPMEHILAEQSVPLLMLQKPHKEQDLLALVQKARTYLENRTLSQNTPQP